MVVDLAEEKPFGGFLSPGVGAVHGEIAFSHIVNNRSETSYTRASARRTKSNSKLRHNGSGSIWSIRMKLIERTRLPERRARKLGHVMLCPRSTSSSEFGNAPLMERAFTLQTFRTSPFSTASDGLACHALEWCSFQWLPRRAT